MPKKTIYSSIKSKERVKNYGEVFTSEETVNEMLDMFEENDATVFSDIEKTFFEPACGEGIFIVNILIRKFRHCSSKSDYTKAISSVYGMDLQADNVEKTIENIIKLCQGYFKPSKSDVEIINRHIMVADSLKVMNLINCVNEIDFLIRKDFAEEEAERCLNSE